MNRTCAVLLATVIGLFAASSSSASASPAPTWLKAQGISAPNSSNLAPDIAVNAHGDSVAAWVKKGAPLGVEVTTRSAGGAWRPAETLITGAVSGSPRVAIDGAGHATVVWAADDGNNNQPIWAATSTDGVWSAAAPISGAQSGAAPVIAMDERGDAVVAWTGFDGNGEVVSAVDRPPGGAWSKYKWVSDGLALAEAEPDVAIDADGTAVVAWSADGSIQAAFHTLGAGWSKSDTLALGSIGQAGETPRVGIDHGGHATVVWRWASQGLSFPTIEVAEGSRGAAWTQPVSLDGVGATSEPDVAVAPAGDAVATWTRTDGGHTVIEAAVRSGAASPWTAPALLSDSKHDSATPSAAIDPAGNALVAWDQKAVIGHLPYAAWRGAGSPTWGAQHAVAAPADADTTPRVAFDSGGDAVVAFARGTAIDAADYDAAPTLSGVQAPASGPVGEALPFSAVATDLWSAATVAWDFGDGAAATGPSVTHSYAAPGDYTVTVTARDAAGNAVSQTRSVHVPAPPVGDPGAPGSPAPKVFAGLRVARQTIVVRNRVARVKASCPASTIGDCAGTLRLLRGGKVIGHARFAVRAGRHVRIRVRVARVGTVRAAARAHDGAGATHTTRARLRLVSPHGPARHGRR